MFNARVQVKQHSRHAEITTQTGRADVRREFSSFMRAFRIASAAGVMFLDGVCEIRRDGAQGRGREGKGATYRSCVECQ